MAIMKRLVLLLLLLTSSTIPFIYADKMDPMLELSKGNIPGHSRIHTFGHNEAVGTNLETIWSLGGM